MSHVTTSILTPGAVWSTALARPPGWSARRRRQLVLNARECSNLPNYASKLLPPPPPPTTNAVPRNQTLEQSWEKDPRQYNWRTPNTRGPLPKPTGATQENSRLALIVGLCLGTVPSRQWQRLLSFSFALFRDLGAAARVYRTLAAGEPPQSKPAKKRICSSVVARQYC